MTKDQTDNIINVEHLLNIKVHLFTLLSLHHTIESVISSKKKAIIANINVNAMNIAKSQKWFADFINKSEYVFCDSAGVMLAGRILGKHIPEKITYADWLPKFTLFCEQNKYSLFLLGGRPGIAERAAVNLKKECPNLIIAGCHNGYFSMAKDSDENSKVIDAINKVKPDILVTCFGMPLQEKWLQENWSDVNAHIALTGGAALDYISGELKRPPRWMVDHSLEWLGRLIIEPRRLWKRYIIGNLYFFGRVILKRLKMIKASTLIKCALTFTAAALSFSLYHFFGNTADTHLYSHSSFTWMVTRWQDYGGQYSHCYLIPIVSIYLIIRKRAELIEANKQICPEALFIVIGALLLQIVSARSRLPRLSILSCILLLLSIPWYLYGREIAKKIFFPCAYLLFCIPLNFLDSLTFPLRLLATRISVFLLNGMGIESVRRGTAIISPTRDFALDVADPCSGLRYFLVMVSLFAAYGYLTQKSTMKKWIVFIASAPLAIVANVTRILVISIVAAAWGQEAAGGIYHDFSGYIVFITAVLLMVAIGKIININYKNTWNKYLKKK